MKNKATKRCPWVEIVLVFGHLAIVAGLALSALSERPSFAPPGMSILESFQTDGEGLPR